MATTTSTGPAVVSLHGKTYRTPRRPTVVVCVDGFDPAYLARGVADGALPTLAAFAASGFHETAAAAMPSLTNPNNVSIITGQPTAVHGISGNYFLDRRTGREAMILDDALLRGSTLLAEMAAAGVRVAAVTAKDKLRRILQHGLPLGPSGGEGGQEEDHGSPRAASICFSAEGASDEIVQSLGYAERPSQYSAALSLFVLDAGVQILRDRRADLLYLTLSDFVQHKHAPGSPEADAFMAGIDARLAALVDLGAVVAVTGDHGMSDKCGPGGRPNVLFLQDELEKRFGQACARVICPITDPFVRHHGALGGFARVHLAPGRGDVHEMVAFCRTLPHVDEVLLREDAASRYETPVDREGDFTVVSTKHAVVGSKASEHDLSTISDHRLRSHGGLSEQAVPLLMSVPPAQADLTRDKKWRNFDIFDLVLNYGQ